MRFSVQESPKINEFRTWIPRYDKKGNRLSSEYAYTVGSPYEGQNLQNIGHKIFLKNVFGIKIPELKTGGEAIEIREYNAWSKIHSSIDLKKEVKEKMRKARVIDGR